MTELNQIYLACGCKAMAVITGTSLPSCPVHDCHEIVPSPNLEGRMARCEYSTLRNGSPHPSNYQPSSLALPFFIFKGEDSPKAKGQCAICPFHHQGSLPPEWAIKKGVVKPHDFTPHGPFEYDSYYCGCLGWD